MKLATAFLVATLFLASNAMALTWVGGNSLIPSGSEYSPSTLNSFSITANPGEGEIITSVLFESNFTTPAPSNTTAFNTSPVFYANIPVLPAGEYAYRWHAQVNDSWTNTSWFNYTVNKNISGLRLYLNGSQSNISYPLGSIVNFTAELAVPNELVYMNSTYPGFTNTSGYTMVSYPSLNVSVPGTYMLMAYWGGNANYSASSRMWYFGDTAPLYSSLSSNPSGSSTYGSGNTYTFSVRWTTSNSINNIWFESNHAGSSFVNYTSPSVSNSSGVYTISISNLPAGNFTYRWIANDSIGRMNSTGYSTYNIFKGTPLTLQVTPSTTNVTAGTNVTAKCVLTNSQMGIDSFRLYLGSEEISNDTYYSRSINRSFDIGTYHYVCNTTGSQNYTNQSINYTLNVISNQTLERTFRVIGDSSISIVPGQSMEYPFSVENNMGYNMSNLSVYVNGLDTNWYTIGDIAQSMPNNFTIQGRLSFNIPQSAGQGSHTFTLRITGRTPSGQTNETTKSVVLNINAPQQQSYPPTYSPESADTNINGNEYEFALQWVDDNGLAGYIFSSNVTGTWMNDTMVDLSGTEGWSYARKSVNPGSAVAWKFFMVDSNGLWSASEEFVVGSSLPGFDFGPIAIVIVFIAVAAGAILVISQRKHLPILKEKVEYVYNRSDVKSV